MFVHLLSHARSLLPGNMFMNGPPGFMNRGPRPMPPRPRPPFPGPPQQANNKPPPTTVFVGMKEEADNWQVTVWTCIVKTWLLNCSFLSLLKGNITEHAGDKMIKELLNRCGNVLSWKRVQGASGKLQVGIRSLRLWAYVNGKVNVAFFLLKCYLLKAWSCLALTFLRTMPWYT